MSKETIIRMLQAQRKMGIYGFNLFSDPEEAYKVWQEERDRILGIEPNTEYVVELKEDRIDLYLSK
ncbi:MAG: hypothetical protein PVI03_03205 [Candidatus Thorarchaeota archaeon]|jgi:hypothetical protein